MFLLWILRPSASKLKLSHPKRIGILQAPSRCRRIQAAVVSGHGMQPMHTPVLAVSLVMSGSLSCKLVCCMPARNLAGKNGLEPGFNVSMGFSPFPDTNRGFAISSHSTESSPIAGHCCKISATQRHLLLRPISDILFVLLQLKVAEAEENTQQSSWPGSWRFSTIGRVGLAVIGLSFIIATCIQLQVSLKPKP